MGCECNSIIYSNAVFWLYMKQFSITVHVITVGFLLLYRSLCNTYVYVCQEHFLPQKITIKHNGLLFVHLCLMEIISSLILYYI
jgi:hypothetical protein